jgi:Domain of unknown function (DUF4145)
MSRAPVPPSFGAESFSCPHCGALAHQKWFKVIPESFERGAKPHVLTPEVANNMRKQAKASDDDADDNADEKENNHVRALLTRFAKNEVTYFSKKYSSQSYWEMVNVTFSQCHSCDGFAIWIKDGIVFPSHDVAILPHDDMPNDVKTDFVEAAEIVNKSPRGAAALLRLAIQKLMPHLEEGGKDLNTAIGNLVKKGLDQKVQQALDVVRVTGNNAVHPGELDLKDDNATAMQLFALVNIIVQSTISAKTQIEAMYASLPPGALKAIEKRDGSA